MSKYKLSIERDKQIIEIDWSSLLDKEEIVRQYKEKKGIKDDKDKKNDEKSKKNDEEESKKIIDSFVHQILSIDKLTTRFENSVDLKKFLNKNKVLGDINGSLCIVYKAYGKNKKIKYGLSYKKDYIFLTPQGVWTFIEERINECDTKFIKGLIKKYDIQHPKGQPGKYSNDIIILNNYIEAINAGTLTEEKKLYVLAKMNRFVTKVAYEYDSKNDRPAIDKEGKYILKYRDLRNLGRFCNNYANKVVEKTLDEQSEEIKQDIKVKTLGSKQFPGQISIEEYLKEK